MMIKTANLFKVKLLILVAVILSVAIWFFEVNTSKAQSTANEEMQEAKPSFMEPDDGDVIWFFAESKDELGSGGELQIYIDPQTHPEAGGSFAKFTLGVGGALPVHKHEKTEEIAYILSGEGVASYFENEELKEATISAGYVWHNPQGAWHSVQNTGSDPLVMVFATIPNEKMGLLSFFRKIGVTPGEEATPISPEEFNKLASEHDLILKPSNLDKE